MEPHRSVRIKNGDVYGTLLSEHPYMIDRARANYSKAHSYRGFLVGAVGFAVDHARETGYFFDGSNVKKSKHADKVCAEKRIIASVHKKQLEQVVGIVVAATTDRDKIEEVTGLRTPTLHCCDDCRQLLADSHSVSDNTLITTIGVTKDIYEVHDFGTMSMAYDTQTMTPAQPIEYHPELWSNREVVYEKLSANYDHLRRSSDAARAAIYAMTVNAA